MLDYLKIAKNTHTRIGEEDKYLETRHGFSWKKLTEILDYHKNNQPWNANDSPKSKGISTVEILQQKTKTSISEHQLHFHPQAVY